MKTFKDLSYTDQAQLLKFPAYISLLASTSENGINKKEKKAVIKLTHIRTFTSDPLLSDFYREAENSFENIITELNESLPHEKNTRRESIVKELSKMDLILGKLGDHYAHVFRQSMNAYKQHVSRAHHNVLEFFLFPMPIGDLLN
jgi:hypothetical protein